MTKVPGKRDYSLIYATTFALVAVPAFCHFWFKARKNRDREDIKQQFLGMFTLGRSLKTERMLAGVAMMAEFMQLTALSFVGSIPWSFPGWVSSLILFKLSSEAQEQMDSWIDAHTLFMVMFWGMVATWVPIVLIHTLTTLHTATLGKEPTKCFRPVYYLWFLVKSYIFVFFLECFLMPAVDVFMSALACTYEDPKAPILIVDPDHFSCFVGSHLSYIVIAVVCLAYMFVVALRHAEENHRDSPDFYYLPRFDVARVGLDFSLSAALAFVSDDQPWAYLTFITMISVVLLCMNYTMQPCIGSAKNYVFNHARTGTFCAILWANCMAFVVMVVDDSTQFWPLIVYLVGLPVVMMAGYKVNVRRSEATKSTILGAITGGGGSGGGGGGGGSQKAKKGASWSGGASSKKSTKAKATTKSTKATTNSPMWGGSKS